MRMTSGCCLSNGVAVNPFTKSRRALCSCWTTSASASLFFASPMLNHSSNLSALANTCGKMKPWQASQAFHAADYHGRLGTGNTGMLAVKVQSRPLYRL